MEGDPKRIEYLINKNSKRMFFLKQNRLIDINNGTPPESLQMFRKPCYRAEVYEFCVILP